MGELTIKEVVTRKDLKEFIYLPEKIHKNETDWLPPLYMDEWLLFDKKRINHTSTPTPFFFLLSGTVNLPEG
jgi:hypothetical protein